METYSVLTNGKLRFVLMETLESKRICEMPPRSFDETSGLLVHYQSTGADHTFQAPYGTMIINNQEVIHRRHADKEWIDARIILAAGKGHCHMAVEQGDAYYSLESFQPVTPDATKEFVLSYNIHPSYSGDDVASHKLYLQQLRGGVLTPFENFMKERFVFDIEILRDQVPHQLYIAGGSVLHYTKRRGTPENIARQDGFYQNTDCDIYVHERHELAVRQALVNQMGVYVPRPQEGVNPANGQPNDYYNIHAPAPANFFRRNFQEQLRRNNIGVVSNVMFGDKKVQIVGVIDDYPIEDVIRNFDFTICSLAYNLRTREFEPFQKQGEDVLADINNNVMHIRKNYIKFLMAPDLFGARLTKQRYEKYTRRGFRFIYPTRDDFVAVVMQTLEIGRDPGAQEDE